MMTDRDDLIAQILTHRRTHERQLSRVRADTDASPADRLAAISSEHKRATQRHAKLVADYRAVTQETDSPEPAPTDINAAIRQVIAAMDAPPSRSALFEDLVVTAGLPVPPELGG